MDRTLRPLAASDSLDSLIAPAPTSGERFEGAATIVRVNAEYPESWTIRVHEVDAPPAWRTRERLGGGYHREEGAA